MEVGAGAVQEYEFVYEPDWRTRKELHAELSAQTTTAVKLALPEIAAVLNRGNQS